MADYTLWQSLLEAAQRGERPPSIDVNEPQPGFYRVRRKGELYQRVAIWVEDEALIFEINDERQSANQALQQWPWVSKNPITYEAFVYHKTHGRWEDIDETVHEMNERERIGGNNPPDELTLIKEQIESATAGAAAYKEIADDETQKKAQSLRARLLELSGEADKKREAEKKPHWDAAKAVDEKWQPLVKAAKAMADVIRAAMSAWETKKSERLRKEREEAEAKAKAVGQEPPPPPQAPPKPQIKGAVGRTASVRPVRVVKAITDQDKLYEFFKSYGEVGECLLKLAREYTKAYPNEACPGVQIADEMTVK